MSKSKKWILSFFIILIIGLGSYMALCYYANPLGYFTLMRGETRVIDDDYNRSLKAEYILAHKDEIEGIIMGGSKAGVISPEQMTSYTGLNYYNMHWNQGNFADYLRFTEFLLEQTNIKEITIFLSSYETRRYDRSSTSNQYAVPAVLSGNAWNKFVEMLSYLVTDQKTVRDALAQRSESREYWDNLTNGTKYILGKYNSFTKDPEKYIQKNVLSNLEKSLEKLFVTNTTQERQRENRSLSLQAMEQIVTLCNEHNVTLRVVAAPAVITERYYYENPEYYTYLAEMVNIVGEIWDFSDFNELNMNPYNFYNEKHYSPALADLMVDTIFGGASVDGFGQLLTPDNVQEKMQERLNDLNSLQEEYLAAGTISMPGIEDDSYIPWSLENGILNQTPADK